MALLGLSLLVVVVLWLVIWHPLRMSQWFLRWSGLGGTGSQDELQRGDTDKSQSTTTKKGNAVEKGQPRPMNGSTIAPSPVRDSKHDQTSMPPPPLPPSVQPPPDEELEEQTTPKASASRPSQSVPDLMLPQGLLVSDEDAGPKSHGFAMPPPPRPVSTPSSAPRLPSLQQFPAANSAQRASGPVPNRGRPASSGLAPPPTHSSVPQKPSRKVILTPGHSPLDWARISGPAADLRGVPSSSPYLHIPPSRLKMQTGRKGKDAWTALNGKVYNITPYLKFHPGGVPELMRAAGRDGTRLFGEIHPWVNYETMLSACLVGLLVDEPPPGSSTQSEMDRMD